MRKLIVVLMLALVALIGVFTAPQAQAQEVPLTGITAFAPSGNYMSLPGYYRWRYYQASGRWISREEAEERVRAAGGNVGPAPVGDGGGAG